MTYTQMCKLLSDDIDNRFELILGYDDFQVWLDTVTKKYYYLEGGINDASECYEVKIIAQLQYDIKHDLQIDHITAGQILHELFLCDCCGEYVHDEGLEYLWFDRCDTNL